MNQSRQKKDTALFIMKILIITINTCLFAGVWYLYYSEKLYRTGFYRRGDYVVVALYFLVIAIMSKIYNGLDLRTSRISELIYSHVVSITITSFIMYLVIVLLSRRFVNVLPMLVQMILCFIMSTVWSFLANHWTNHIYPPARVILAYDNMDAYKNGKSIIEKLPWRFHLAAEVKMVDIESWSQNYQQEMKQFKEAIHHMQADSVMLCGLASSQRNDILKYCVENDIRVFVRPNIGDFIISNGEALQMANLPVLICQKSAPGLGYVAIKRLMDLVVSLVALIILSPILLITAIAIKCNDHGPVLYKQQRLTKDGKCFNVLKFRSMKVDAEKDGVARLSAQGDSRITSVGKVIRACRIDELPQIFNIIKGDMSLVGPRPERPEIAAQYEETMPEFKLRLQAKAGLTGYAQVYGKYNTEPYDKLQMDLMYISKLRITTDIKIIMATIKILFMPESTEGIDAGKTTAMGSAKTSEAVEELAASQEVSVEK